MTEMTIKWLQARENERHNRATEFEQHRSAVRQEELAQGNLDELIRKDLAAERENIRYHDTMADLEQQKIYETRIHNRRDEAIKSTQAQASMLSAQSSLISAQANRTQAEVAQAKANLYEREVAAKETQAEASKTTAEAKKTSAEAQVTANKLKEKEISLAHDKLVADYIFHGMKFVSDLATAGSNALGAAAFAGV